ncbi:serine/threonine-protein phosphatase 7 long form-like protein [Senna tora]|uniref:Serine/threonine-protein phosphatase 7 long form-like protein n=1 Tax=Senna tora TaxID=362788 RepID=A0A834T179_9FABA|nr:serine/threonine-protein phosphatase 7 long form-like protein [Senna tora]
MAMRVRGFLYKNGSCLSGNDGLSFQADRVEGVMLTDDMTLAQLKESIRGRLRMGRGEEICNGQCQNLNGVELLVQTVSSSIVEFDLNVSPVIDEGGSATVVACTQALANFTIEATNIDSAIIEFPSSNVCRRGSSSRRNPAVGESSRQRTAYVNEDEAEMRDPDFVSFDIPDTSSEGDLEASGDDTSDDNGIDEGSDDDGTDGGGGHDYDDDDHVGEVGGGDGLPDERLAPFYDQIDMEAQAGPEFPEDVPPTMDNPLFLGAMFDNKDALRQAVKMYSIRQYRDYTVFKSKATFVDYRCKWYNNPCPWRMRARERDYYWEITRYVGPHTCVTPTLTQDNPKMDSTFIASCIVPDVIMTPSIRVSAIIDRIRMMFNTTVKYKKAWRAKHKALGRAFGNWDRSYAIMPRWLEAARHFNPGSVVVWEHMPHPENTDEFCFHRVFWTFAPCIAAFVHLKPILQIDGTFLYGKYTGTLLLAVGQDGNKKVVPLAFAIVEKESESSWHWFLTLLRRHLVKDRTDICLISDRHLGILNAVNDETLMWHPPYAENVYCVRHLTSNLNKAYKNAKLKKLFVRTARTTQKHRVETNLRIFRHGGETSNTQKADGNGSKGASREGATYAKTMRSMQANWPQAWVMPKSRELRPFIFVTILIASIIMAARRQHINPGPENMSLLTQQQNHISERIWNGDDNRVLRSRRSCAVDDGLPPPCIVPYLIQAGFYGVSRVGHFEYVRPLIRALVERWCPETHTFHFPQGECTITLQDVVLQLGLPCSGYVVTGTEKHNYRELCMELLGIELPQQRQTRKGQRVSMSWLKSQFQYVPDHNSPEVYKQRYTRQYILHLLEGYLIPDKTSTDCCLMYLPLLRDFAECGQYSWGSADRFPKLAPPRPPPRDPLAHIYQPLPPLAARWQGMLTTARPATSSHHMYRQMIDRMDECGDIDWTPYSSMLERGEIPNEYLQHPDIWRASVPLVNFAIVEWHHSDRVLRQFGMTQSIPGQPRDLSDVHGLSLRNKSHQTWYERHKAWIDIWFQWPALVCTTSVAPTHLDRRSDYMQWYRRHTRRWIHPDSAAQGYAGDVADRTMSQVHEQGASHHPFARDVGMGLTDLMQVLGTQLPPYAQGSFQYMQQHAAGGMEHDQFNTPLANPYVPSPPEPSRGPHFCEGGPSNAFQGLCTPRELFGDASQCQSPSFGTLYSDLLVHQQPPPMDFMSTFDPDVSSLWSGVMGPDVNVGQHSPHVAHTGLTFDLNQPPSEEPGQQPESQQFGDSQPCHNQSEDEDPAVPRRTGRRRAPTRCGTGSHYNIH